MFANLIHPRLSLFSCSGGEGGGWESEGSELAEVCVCLTKLCMKAISNMSCLDPLECVTSFDM